MQRIHVQEHTEEGNAQITDWSRRYLGYRHCDAPDERCGRSEARLEASPSSRHEASQPRSSSWMDAWATPRLVAQPPPPTLIRTPRSALDGPAGAFASRYGSTDHRAGCTNCGAGAGEDASSAPTAATVFTVVRSSSGT